jgi:hypothetical protein
LHQVRCTLTYNSDPILHSWAPGGVTFPLLREQPRYGARNRAVMSPTTRSAPIGPALAFTTNDSVEWTVREFANSGSSSDEDGVRCLVFECQDAMRRVRRFPTNWRDLGRAELLALSWKT